MTSYQDDPLYLFVNFGGPRSLEEISSFLKALLCDKDVIRTKLPYFLHRWFFSFIAQRRARVIRHDYISIGGKSPIFEDTENIASAVARYKNISFSTFHRYLPALHRPFLEKLSSCATREIRIFPFFPQFSYATTGSIARWFSQHLCGRIVRKMRWIKSYCAHPAYIGAMQKRIRSFLEEQHLDERETILLFSAHGLPKKFICAGDVYEKECETSFIAVKAAFPQALSLLAYQSKFGAGEWLRPYTQEICAASSSWGKGFKNVVVIPLSFTSDHIETLFEIEQLYLPLLREQGFRAFRCPALNRESYWIEAIGEILEERNLLSNQMLIAAQLHSCCSSCNQMRCCACR